MRCVTLWKRNEQEGDVRIESRHKAQFHVLSLQGRANYPNYRKQRRVRQGNKPYTIISETTPTKKRSMSLAKRGTAARYRERGKERSKQEDTIACTSALSSSRDAVACAVRLRTTGSPQDHGSERELRASKRLKVSKPTRNTNEEKKIVG